MNFFLLLLFESGDRQRRSLLLFLLLLGREMSAIRKSIYLRAHNWAWPIKCVRAYADGNNPQRRPGTHTTTATTNHLALLCAVVVCEATVVYKRRRRNIIGDGGSAGKSKKKVSLYYYARWLFMHNLNSHMKMKSEKRRKNSAVWWEEWLPSFSRFLLSHRLLSVCFRR